MTEKNEKHGVAQFFVDLISDKQQGKFPLTTVLFGLKRFFKRHSSNQLKFETHEEFLKRNRVEATVSLAQFLNFVSRQAVLFDWRTSLWVMQSSKRIH